MEMSKKHRWELSKNAQESFHLLLKLSFRWHWGRGFENLVEVRWMQAALKMLFMVWSARQYLDAGLQRCYHLMQMAVSRPIQVHAGVFIGRQVMPHIIKHAFHIECLSKALNVKSLSILNLNIWKVVWRNMSGSPLHIFTAWMARHFGNSVISTRFLKFCSNNNNNKIWGDLKQIVFESF